MSIKKNNKQISGNYVNVNFNELTKEIKSVTQQVTDIGNTHIENINREANDKLNSMTQLYNYVLQIAETLGGAVIGNEKVWRGETAPENYIFMEGQLLSRIEYNDLFQWAITNNLIVEDVEWQDYKKHGLYSYGDGETTFRIPKMTGYYLVGYDPNKHTGLGIEQPDMIPEITGSLDLRGTNDSSLMKTSSASGVFKINSKTASSYPITGSTNLTEDLVDTIEFDISEQVNTGDRVQPLSIPVKYIVCYKNAYNS